VELAPAKSRSAGRLIASAAAQHPVVFTGCVPHNVMAFELTDVRERHKAHH
jgi:hypothetical protein